MFGGKVKFYLKRLFLRINSIILLEFDLYYVHVMLDNRAGYGNEWLSIAFGSAPLSRHSQNVYPHPAWLGSKFTTVLFINLLPRINFKTIPHPACLNKQSRSRRSTFIRHLATKVYYPYCNPHFASRETSVGPCSLEFKSNIYFSLFS